MTSGMNRTEYGETHDSAAHYRVNREPDDGRAYADAERQPSRRQPSPRQPSGGLRLPFGVPGVAAIGAVALGLIGLLIPTATLEAVSFQLYLDRLTAAALPPLGLTAHLVTALALALIGGLAGYVLARLFGVVSSDFSFQGLIQRLRGDVGDDEADAPALRAADRHPDAPARRPFSAARDIPARDEQAWPARDTPDWDDDEDDALLLDSHFVPAADDELPAMPPVGAAPHPGTSFDDVWEKIADTPAVPVHVPAHVIEDHPIDAQSSSVEPDPDEVSLPAPSLDDWERDEDVVVPSVVVPAAASVIASAAEPIVELTGAPLPISVAPIVEQPKAPPMAQPIVEPAAVRAPLPPVDPLDLSAARLDDLLARLEQGLGRRGGVAPTLSAADVAAMTSETTPVPSRDVPSPVAEMPRETIRIEPPVLSSPTQLDRAVEGTVVDADGANDPAFPHDPALAAALKTLRRLNQRAMA